MQTVAIEPTPLERLGSLLAPDRARLLAEAAARTRAVLGDRVVWNVNATAHGGGVAEMLQALLAYGRGAGVDTRWLTLDGDPEFFAVTKRVHNAIHGSAPPDGLGPAEHDHYEQVLAANLADLRELVREGDVVILHDPQTAGLAEGVRGLGARVVWRCHIGRDTPDETTDRGWEFLRGYLGHVDAHVFSRSEYVPDWMPSERVRVIPPSIDPWARKNMDLDPEVVGRVLRCAGLVADGHDEAPVTFDRRDGTRGEVRRRSGLLGDSPPPPPDAPVVAQVSRWDRLKDMAGVLTAFAEHVAPRHPEAHLMLVGPDVTSVSDDPEGAEVLAECRDTRQRLAEDVRRRCHLVELPMEDVDENAVLVNAVQRGAAVVTQKSIAEGFGLTVTEAMWKSRPVVASAVGGIQDQVHDGREGLLLPDPQDLAGFAERVCRLLEDTDRAEAMGRAARERVRDCYLGDRHLIDYGRLLADVVASD